MQASTHLNSKIKTMREKTHHGIRKADTFEHSIINICSGIHYKI